MDQMLARMKREGEVHCPYCDHIAPQDEGQFISYHGEDSQEKTTCEHCDKTFWLEEHVKRTYTTAMTRMGLEVDLG